MATLGVATTARLHPLVLFNISDSYIRRNEGQDRVIGTLLGSVVEGGVEIKNSYPVPHNDSGGQGVALDIEYHRTMLELHLRVNPKEVIVGWYSTGAGISDSDALIHDFYTRETPNAIHLAIDTAFVDESKAIRAWTGQQLLVGDTVLGTNFVELVVDLRFQEAERVGLDLLTHTSNDGLPGDLQALERSVGRLQTLLQSAAKYVDDVCEGRLPPNNAVGRYLADTVAAVPRLSRESFERLFVDSVQDILLVMYLSNLTKTQLALSEKLNVASLAII